MTYPDRRSPVLTVLPLVLAGGAFALATWMLWQRLLWTPHMSSAPRDITPRGTLAEFETATVQLFAETSPSVVHITAPGGVARDRYGYGYRVPEGTGSGFVWDENGYVVTNWHVVEGRESVVVRFNDQREYEAQVIGSQPDQDIAVLRLYHLPPNLSAIPRIGSSTDLRVGQAVFAIGNPFGYDQSLSTGVISALNRSITTENRQPIHGCIQVDAAINPGNSGGPLLDSAGRLIGMNTAIYSPSGASAGIGFAIPVDTINEIVPTLIDPSRAPLTLGVVLRPMEDDGGLMVQYVARGSGAAEAGVRGYVDVYPSAYGDVLLSIDGEPVHSPEQIRDILARHKRGDVVDVEILRGLPRDEQRLTLRVPLR